MDFPEGAHRKGSGGIKYPFGAFFFMLNNEKIPSIPSIIKPRNGGGL
jgi:hypothetical protein